MDISIVRQEEYLCVSWNSVSAQVHVSQIRLGHMGCKLLGTLTDVPRTLQTQWDEEFGRIWKSKKDSKAKLSKALYDALCRSEMDSAVLWDTMRTGSDYWRPGKLILESVEMLPPQLRNNISYAREDVLCPPRELLKEFMNGDNMAFGQYATEYARHLNTEGILSLATASVLLNLAQGRLPVFYCVDPYIPHYLEAQEFCSNTAYGERHWLEDLRFDGCHRVILVEEIAKALLAYGVHVNVFELDPTFDKAHHRSVKPDS